MAILREWRGYASLTEPDAYPRHFRTTVMPALRTVPGFLGASLSRRVLPDQIEFLVLTRWRSRQAIAAFAGPNPEHAVVEPAAVAALQRFDPTVAHYEVLDEG